MKVLIKIGKKQKKKRNPSLFINACVLKNSPVREDAHTLLEYSLNAKKKNARETNLLCVRARQQLARSE